MVPDGQVTGCPPMIGYCWFGLTILARVPGYFVYSSGLMACCYSVILIICITNIKSRINSKWDD